MKPTKLHLFILFCIGILTFFIVRPVSATLNEIQYVSVRADGTLGAGVSAFPPSITDDGRFIVFTSQAADILLDSSGNVAIEPGTPDTDIFIKDMTTGTISLLARSTTGSFPTGNSTWPTITPDGRFVAFQSNAADLAAGDTDTNWDVFVIDRGTDNDETNNSITRVSLTVDGNEQTTEDVSVRADSISDDGNYVVFITTGPMGGSILDTNNNNDIYLWSRSTGKSTLISHSASSLTTTADGASNNPALSHDGKFIVFQSTASNLTANADTDGTQPDIFLYDIANKTTTRIPYTAAPGSAATNTEPKISADNNIIIWNSGESLVEDDKNGLMDVYMYNRSTGDISAVSTFNYGTTSNSVEPSSYSILSSNNSSLSADGSKICRFTLHIGQ